MMIAPMSSVLLLLFYLTHQVQFAAALTATATTIKIDLNQKSYDLDLKSFCQTESTSESIKGAEIHSLYNVPSQVNLLYYDSGRNQYLQLPNNISPTNILQFSGFLRVEQYLTSNARFWLTYRCGGVNGNTPIISNSADVTFTNFPLQFIGVPFDYKCPQGSSIPIWMNVDQDAIYPLTYTFQDVSSASSSFQLLTGPNNITISDTGFYPHADPQSSFTVYLLTSNGATVNSVYTFKVKCADVTGRKFDDWVKFTLLIEPYSGPSKFLDSEIRLEKFVNESSIEVALNVMSDPNAGLNFRADSIPTRGLWFLLNSDGQETRIFASGSNSFSTASSKSARKTINLQFRDDNKGSIYPPVLANFTLVMTSASSTESSRLRIIIAPKCDPGLYNNVWSTVGPICQKCPTGAVCSEDGREWPFSNDGYYQINSTFYPCYPDSACLQRNNCSSGYNGIRCGSCSNGFYHVGNYCEKCSNFDLRNNPVLVLGIGLLVLIVFLCISYYFRDADLSFSKLILTYLQALSIIRLLKLRNIFAFFTLKIEYLQPECFIKDSDTVYPIKYKSTMTMPLVLGGVVVFAVILLRIIIKIFACFGAMLTFGMDQDLPTEKEEDEGANSTLVASLMKSYIILLDVLYFSLAEASLELFDCTRFEGVSFFEAESNRLCYQSWWYELLPFSILGLVLYTIGIPLLSYYLYSQRQRILAIPPIQRGSWHKTVLKWTYEKKGSFKPGFEYWRSVITIRKLGLVAVKMFFTNFVHFQAVMFIFVYFVSFWLQNEYKPYDANTLNKLEQMCLASSIFILLGGVMSKMNNGLDRTQQLVMSVALIGSVLVCTLVVLYYALLELKHMFRSTKEMKIVDRLVHEGTLKKGSRPGSLKFTKENDRNKASMPLGELVEEMKLRKPAKMNDE